MNIEVGEEVPLPPRICPQCGSEGHSTACVGSDDAPVPGDLSICAECGYMMAFGDDMNLYHLSEQDQLMVACDPKVKAVEQYRKSKLRRH